MRIELTSTGWFRGRLEATVDGLAGVSIERRGWCGQSADFRLGGRSYQLKASGFGHHKYALLDGTQTVARAWPTGFFGTTYELELNRAPQAWQRLRFEREGWSGWRHALLAGDEQVGRIQSSGVLQRRDNAEFQIPLEVPEALFCCLVRRLVQEARQYVAVT